MTSALGHRASSKRFARFVADEWFLAIGAASSAVFVFRGDALAAQLSTAPGLALLFAWLFAVAFGCCLSVVRHADHLARRLGEPYGTLILTLAVTIIEVMSISALVTHGTDNAAALVRDTVFAVIMIFLNGMVGLSLLLGGWRHVEQQFNLQGAKTYLGVIIPLTVLGLILPNYATTTPGPTFSATQEAFVVVAFLSLYLVFLAIQTVRHRAYFRSSDGEIGSSQEVPNSSRHSPLLHAILLVSYMIALVFLAERLAAPVDTLLASLQAPAALGGVIVALLVTTPEALSAVRAAASNRLQRSMNILLGSVVSTIGLTIPVMICISHFGRTQLVLGLQAGDAIMLALTLAVSLVTFSSGRTNILQGAIHLILFSAYIMLIFEG